MECNKDEATRAKELAEKKFTAKDMKGAKKFALKAQNLYPDLDGIPQMIATLDVYISAENKINGEADWYAILGVNPQADDEAVRKQYRKLALMLHPDKNKSIGAEGAFKLISEAWSLLSDKARRVAYDKRRGGKVAIPAPSGSSKVSKTANGFYNAAKTSTSSMKTSKSSNPHGAQSSIPSGRSSNIAGQSSNPASSHKPKPNTFWTICHRCKMHYEYLRVYLNHNLLCPNCHEAFLAIETAPPTTSTPTPWTFAQPQQNSNSGNKSSSNMARNHSSSYNAAGFTSHDPYNQSNFEWGPFSRTGGTSTAAHAASVVQQAYQKVRREREEAQAATKREEAMRKKHHGSKRAGASSSGYTNAAKRRRGMEDGSACVHETNITNQMGVANGGPANLSGPKLASLETGWINGTNKYNNARDFSQVDTQSMLIDKTKREIRKKLNEWNSSPEVKTTSKDVRCNENANDKQNKSLEDNNAETLEAILSGSVNEANGDHFAKPFPGSSGVALDAETLKAMSINVPDPDFHDFDKDRTERSFEDNQVWAAYDDDDGMPRYYAMIRGVISQDPFKIKISWLNSKTNSEFSTLDWVGSGFSKTCGEFRIGRHEINNSLNSFSHKVRWTKGMRGAICIYPRKGDVWAIYRHWSRDWNELTTNDVIHKYDMVEVLDDYNEELGVTVTPLVKVAGFKTVFHRHLDHREIRRIPREEMFRFSHQVPSYLLTGQEAPNAPKGCRELDPAATPVELLQVIMDVKDEEILEDGKMIKEDNVVDVEKANNEGMVVNCEKEKKENSGSKAPEEIVVLANVGNT